MYCQSKRKDLSINELYLVNSMMLSFPNFQFQGRVGCYPIFFSSAALKRKCMVNIIAPGVIGAITLTFCNIFVITEVISFVSIYSRYRLPRRQGIVKAYRTKLLRALPGSLTHYQTTNLDPSKLKEFADDNFKFDENGRKLSKWVENTVGKGEIACYEQFLLFPQCFQNACFPGASKGVMWEWVTMLGV